MSISFPYVSVGDVMGVAISNSASRWNAPRVPSLFFVFVICRVVSLVDPGFYPSFISLFWYCISYFFGYSFLLIFSFYSRTSVVHPISLLSFPCTCDSQLTSVRMAGISRERGSMYNHTLLTPVPVSWCFIFFLTMSLLIYT